MEINVRGLVDAAVNNVCVAVNKRRAELPGEAIGDSATDGKPVTAQSPAAFGIGGFSPGVAAFGGTAAADILGWHC